MNDNAIASVGGTSRVALGGLAQRLVQDGLLDEQAMQDAIAKAKEKRVNLVTHLVTTNLATARDIAISASNEFGVPLLDLDAVAIDHGCGARRERQADAEASRLAADEARQALVPGRRRSDQSARAR